MHQFFRWKFDFGNIIRNIARNINSFSFQSLTETVEISISEKMFFNLENFSARKYFFSIQKLGWKFIGFWPGSDNITKFQLALVFFNVFEVLIYCIFQLNFCYVKRERLVVVLDALTPLATQFTTSIKVLVIVTWRKELKIVLDHLRDSFSGGELGNREGKKQKVVKMFGKISWFSGRFCKLINTPVL